MIEIDEKCSVQTFDLIVSSCSILFISIEIEILEDGMMSFIVYSCGQNRLLHSAHFIMIKFKKVIQSIWCLTAKKWRKRNSIDTIFFWRFIQVRITSEEANFFVLCIKSKLGFSNPANARFRNNRTACDWNDTHETIVLTIAQTAVRCLWQAVFSYRGMQRFLEPHGLRERGMCKDEEHVVRCSYIRYPTKTFAMTPCHSKLT